MATYVPGVCNIGPEEAKLRMRAGWIGLVITVLLSALFAYIKAVPALALVLFIPAFITALGFLQAAFNFCVAFGMQGLFNVSSEAGKTETVAQAEFRQQDQQRAILIILLSIVIGALFASLAFLYAKDVANAPAALPPVPQAIPGDNLTLGEDGSATLGNYLIGYTGMPVYTYGKDLDGTSHCDATCLGADWKPYVVTSSSNLVGEAPIDSSRIGTTTRSDGSVQVTYKGQPLYFYAPDTDDTPTGQGLDYTWYVARP